jgi:homoserine/homoserine lactone efflux protein
MTLVLFFAVCLLSTATPGPAILYVTSQGVSGGMRSALPSSVGVLTADAFYILLSITGLTAVLVSSYELFTLIKWIGAGYLVYLGLRHLWICLLAAPAHDLPEKITSASSRAFLGGFALHAANPKALLYFGSLVPQFVDPARSLVPQLSALAFIHLATASGVLLVYSLLSTRLRQATASRRVRRVFHAATGSFLVGAGVSLAITRRAVS